jgi:hypothetical protein
MSTAEFVEECLDIKLAQHQKDYMDYLDKHPDTKITIPRGRGIITGYELWILGRELKFWIHML